jgi:glutamyl-tRNA reductase
MTGISVFETAHRHFETMLNRMHCRAHGEALENGIHSNSQAAAALVRLAGCIFGSISEQHLLLIGAGEMIELCAAHFCAQHPKRVTVADRTRGRARMLARRLDAHAIALNELPTHLEQHDIVITCTPSPLPILGKGMMERAIKVRRHRPILMVDLALPRDVELEVADLDDVFLYTVDDLVGLVRDAVETGAGAMV